MATPVLLKVGTLPYLSIVFKNREVSLYNGLAARGQDVYAGDVIRFG